MNGVPEGERSRIGSLCFGPQANQVRGALREKIEFRRLAEAVEELPARGLEVEQQLPLRSIPDEALPGG